MRRQESYIISVWLVARPKSAFTVGSGMHGAQVKDPRLLCHGPSTSLTFRFGVRQLQHDIASEKGHIIGHDKLVSEEQWLSSIVN